MPYAFNDDKSKFDLDDLAGNLATIEASPVITNHETGEYIIYNNMLFQVTSPIATGEDLVLGTNVSPVNIGDQLKVFQDFMNSSPFKANVSWRTVTNLNFDKDNCYVRFDDVAGMYCANTPVSGNGVYIVMTMFGADDSYACQVAFSYALVGTHLYIRRRAGYGWDSWSTIM